MYYIGELKDDKLAQKILLQLKTQGIDATSKLDEKRDVYSLYVLDENKLEEGREILRVLLGLPSNKTYEIDPEWKNISKVPLTDINKVIIALSVMISASLLLFERNDIYELLSFSLNPKEPWRIFTPALLHFSFLHIIFNMLWMKDIGSTLEFERGSFFYILFVLLTGSISNIAQGLVVGSEFGGMSGVVYALVGYSFVKGWMNPSFNYRLPKRDYIFLFGFYILCYTGLIGRIANVAHGVGLGLGFLFAFEIKRKGYYSFLIGLLIIASSIFLEKITTS